MDKTPKPNADALADLERRIQREEHDEDREDRDDREELRRFNRYADLRTASDLVRGR